jgi:hypothetical protein
MTNLPANLTVDSLIANPAAAVYICSVGFAYVMYDGLEEPMLIGTSESRYVRQSLNLGTMERVLSDIYQSDKFPLGTLVSVASSNQQTPPEMLYSEELAKSFDMYEQLVLQKHLYIPEWNFGPLGIQHVLNPEQHKQLTEYCWLTNSGSGHVDFKAMTQQEMKGVESLLQSGVFVESPKEQSFHNIRLADVNPDTTKIPPYTGWGT